MLGLGFGVMVLPFNALGLGVRVFIVRLRIRGSELHRNPQPSTTTGSRHIPAESMYGISNTEIQLPYPQIPEL